MARFGWRWLGFSGFQWGWVVVVEIGVAMEIGVGLGFVFIGLFGGGVFLGFRGGRWSVVEVEISVAVEIGVAVGLGFMFTNLGLVEFGLVFVVFFLYGFVCLFLGFIGFDLLEVYGFGFLDLLGLIY